MVQGELALASAILAAPMIWMQRKVLHYMAIDSQSLINPAVALGTEVF